MYLNSALEQNIRKSFVLCFGFILILSLWFIEKTKTIPQYGIIFYEMGVRCENRCRQDKQLHYFQKAVFSNANLSAPQYRARFSDAYYRSGLIYEKRGDSGRALEYFKKAAEVDQGNGPAYYKMGRHFFMEGDHENARRNFLHCYTRLGCPDDKSYYLAQIYERMNKYELAIVYYGEFVLIRPEFAAKVYPHLARLYYSLNDKGEAISVDLHVLRKTGKYNLADLLEENFNAYQASQSSAK